MFPSENFSALDCYFVILLMTTLLVVNLFICKHLWGMARVVVQKVDASRALLIALLAGYVVLLVFIGGYSTQFAPGSADEFAYLYQAETFLAGRVSNPVIADPDTFRMWPWCMYENAGRISSHYPPGWPATLASFMFFGVPGELVNLLLSLLVIGLFYSFASRFYDRKIVLLSCFVLASSPFFIFNALSTFSHVSVLVFFLCFLLFLHSENIGKRWYYAVFAGVFLGACFVTRYFTAVCLGALPLAWIFLARKEVPLTEGKEGFRARYKILFQIALGFLVVFSLNAFYNSSVTGNPFLEPLSHKFGGGEPFSVLGSELSYLWGRVLEPREWFQPIHREFFIWLTPLALFLYVTRLFQVRVLESVQYIEFIFVVVLLGHLFVFPWYPGEQFGPRYFFEVYPFFLLSVCCLTLPDKIDVSRWVWLSRASLLTIVQTHLILNVFFAMDIRREIISKQRLDRAISALQIEEAVIVTGEGVEPYSAETAIRAGLLRNDIDFKNDPLKVLMPSFDCTLVQESFPGKKIYRIERDILGLTPELALVCHDDERERESNL